MSHVPGPSIARAAHAPPVTLCDVIGRTHAELYSIAYFVSSQMQFPKHRALLDDIPFWDMIRICIGYVEHWSELSFCVHPPLPSWGASERVLSCYRAFYNAVDRALDAFSIGGYNLAQVVPELTFALSVLDERLKHAIEVDVAWHRAQLPQASVGRQSRKQKFLPASRAFIAHVLD